MGCLILGRNFQPRVMVKWVPADRIIIPDRTIFFQCRKGNPLPVRRLPASGGFIRLRRVYPPLTLNIVSLPAMRTHSFQV
jgi:hypothetical protein